MGAIHSLHEHGQLAVALAKATRGVSVHVPSPDNRQHTIVSKNYVDGAVLIEEMRHTADVLAAGMLEVSHPDVARSFFDAQVRSSLSTWALDDSGKVRREVAFLFFLSCQWKLMWDSCKAGFVRIVESRCGYIILAAKIPRLLDPYVASTPR